MAVNTRFKKPAEKQVTCKEKVPQHNPLRGEYEGENARPFYYKKYAQCDYVLTRKEHFSYDTRL